MVNTSSSKLKLASMILLSFAAPFMIFIFSPLDLFFHNTPSFLGSFDILLPWLLLYMFIGFAGIFLILFFLWKQNVLFGILVILLCAIYVTYSRFVLNSFHSIYIFLYILITVALTLWLLLIKVFKEYAVKARS